MKAKQDARRKPDIKKLDKKIEEIQRKCHQELQILAGEDFACVADALAAEKLSTKILTYSDNRKTTLCQVG